MLSLHMVCSGVFTVETADLTQVLKSPVWVEKETEYFFNLSLG